MTDPENTAEAAFLAYVHRKSLSDDPFTACWARFAKQAVPLVPQFIEAEQERGTHPEHVTHAVLEAEFLMLMGLLGALGIKDKRTRLQSLKVLRRAFDDRFRDKIKEVKREPN